MAFWPAEIVADVELPLAAPSEKSPADEPTNELTLV
jgi:hypothetical protein